MEFSGRAVARPVRTASRLRFRAGSGFFCAMARPAGAAHHAGRPRPSREANSAAVVWVRYGRALRAARTLGPPEGGSERTDRSRPEILAAAFRKLEVIPCPKSN